MTETLTRPWLTLSELSAASGRHRRTIRRMLDTGAFGEGTRQDDDGRWLVAVDAALAAGLALHRPRPDPATVRNRGAEPRPQDDEFVTLRAQLADAQQRALVAEAEARGMRNALAALQEAVSVMARALPPAGDTPLPHHNGATLVADHPSRSRWWRRHRTAESPA